MAEHFPESGARRGRRSELIEAVLDAEVDDVVEDRFTDSQSAVVLRQGDSVMCRVSLEHPTEVGAAWFSWGATTTIGPEESEDEAADRLYSTVTNRVYELIDGVTETVADAVAEQKASKRGRRIPGSN